MRKSSPAVAAALGVALAATLAVAPASSPLGAEPAAPALRGRVAAVPGLDMAAVVVELHTLPTPYEQVRSQAPGEAEATPWEVVRPAADGSFRLVAPAPGMFRVVVRAPGRVAMQRDVVPLVADEELPPVELPAVAALPVRVSGLDGGPVVAARVVVRQGRGDLWARRNGWRPVREVATTDAEGRAAVRHAAGEDEVVVDGNAPSRWGAAVVAAPPAEARLVLRPGVERAVEVRRPRGPAVRAALLLVADGAHRTVADGGGRTRLTLPAGEPVELRIETADGWRGHYRVQVEAPGEGEAPPPPLRFVLEPPVELPVRIVAADGGEPIPGALVWLRGEAGAAVSAGPAGEASLGVPATEGVELRAAASGFDGLSLDVAPEDRPVAGRPLVLPLRAESVVAGTVVDPSGLPLPGVRVLLRHRWAMTSAWEPEARGIQAAETDEEGRFRLARLRQREEVVLRAEAEGRAAVETESRAGTVDVRLVLGLGGAVAGRLRAADGGALSGGSIRLFPEAGERAVVQYADGERVGGLTAVPDEGGGFRFPRVPAGRHELVARVPGHQPLTLPGIAVIEGGEVDLGRLDLRPEAVLVGRVVDPEGLPVAGASVVVEQHSPRPWSRRTFGRPGREAAVDEEGGFRVGGLEVGPPITLSVSAEGFVAQERHDVLLPRDEPLEVRLGRGGTLFGEVVDAAGEPLPAARLQARIDFSGAVRTWLPSSRHFAYGETGEDGRFELAGVPAGPLVLRVSHAARRIFHTVSVGELAEGERRGPLRVEVPATFEIAGRVRRAEGGPATDAEVRAFREGERSWAGTRSDALGRFRIGGLEPGPFRVEATLGAEGRAVADVVAGGGEAEVELVLEPTTGVAGRVVDPEGRPVSGGRLRLRSDGGERMDEIDELGRFAVVGLDEGTYRLSAEVAGVGRGELPQPVTVVRGAPVEGLVVELRAGARIRGRVTGVATEDLPQLEISVSTTNGRWWSVDPAFDGTFELRGLAPGRHTLGARLANTGRWESTEVEVAEGDSVEGVEIDFSGLTLTASVTLLGRPLDQPARIETADRVSAGARRLGPGRFAFEGLAPGRHRVVVRASPAGPELAREVEVDGSQELAIDFEGWPVAGRALDEAGKPVPGVTVRVVAPEEEVPPWGPAAPGVLPDAGGAFALPGVPPGSWRLIAAGGRWWGEARVEVAPGGAAGVELTLRPERPAPSSVP